LSLRKSFSHLEQTHKYQQWANFLSRQLLFFSCRRGETADAIKLVLPISPLAGEHSRRRFRSSITYLSRVGVVLVESEAGVARVAGRSPRRHRRGHQQPRHRLTCEHIAPPLYNWLFIDFASAPRTTGGLGHKSSPNLP